MSEQEDAECRPEPRGEPEGLERAKHLEEIAGAKPRRGIAVHPAEDAKDGNHNHREWDHDGGEHDAEENPAAAKLDAGKAVGDDRAG